MKILIKLTLLCGVYALLGGCVTYRDRAGNVLKNLIVIRNVAFTILG